MNSMCIRIFGVESWLWRIYTSFPLHKKVVRHPFYGLSWWENSWWKKDLQPAIPFQRKKEIKLLIRLAFWPSCFVEQLYHHTETWSLVLLPAEVSGEPSSDFSGCWSWPRFCMQIKYKNIKLSHLISSHVFSILARPFRSVHTLRILT